MPCTTTWKEGIFTPSYGITARLSFTILYGKSDPVNNFSKADGGFFAGTFDLGCENAIAVKSCKKIIPIILFFMIAVFN
jgi:hypothetical protein